MRIFLRSFFGRLVLKDRAYAHRMHIYIHDFLRPAKWHWRLQHLTSSAEVGLVLILMDMLAQTVGP